MRRASAVAAVLVLSLMGLVASADAADENEYTTPDSADEVVRAKDVPFRLHFDSEHWQVQPQRSQLKLLARVVHLNKAVSGAFDYREQKLSRSELREREVKELESAFASHAIERFEPRRVNGLEVLYMQAHATTTGGREMAIRSYLWRGPNGTADYGLVINADKLDQYKSQMMDLLNGMELASKENQE